jgi:hypothetical protein
MPYTLHEHYTAESECLRISYSVAHMVAGDVLEGHLNLPIAPFAGVNTFSSSGARIYGAPPARISFTAH